MAEPVAVKNIMTMDVITVSENDTVSDAATRLAESQISGAPVVNSDGKIVGIISDGDILRFLNTYDPKTDKPCKLDPSEQFRVCMQKFGMYSLEPAQAGDLLETLEKASRKTVRDVMVKPVITATPDDDVEKVSSLMLMNGIKRVPIVENGRVVGIVSRADIVRFVAGKKRAKELVES